MPTTKAQWSWSQAWVERCRVGEMNQQKGWGCNLSDDTARVEDRRSEIGHTQTPPTLQHREEDWQLRGMLREDIGGVQELIHLGLVSTRSSATRIQCGGSFDRSVDFLPVRCLLCSVSRLLLRASSLWLGGKSSHAGGLHSPGPFFFFSLRIVCDFML